VKQTDTHTKRKEEKKKLKHNTGKEEKKTKKVGVG